MPSFCRFPRLPAEIRIEIWKIAVSALPPRRKRVYRKAKVWHLHSRPIPSLLLVCWESHNIAARRYSRAFASEDAGSGSWLDFDSDSVKVNLPYHVMLPNHPHMQRVTRITARCSPSFWSIRFYEIKIWLDSFTSLKCLEIETRVDMMDGWSRVRPRFGGSNDSTEVVFLMEGYTKPFTLVQLDRILEDWELYIRRTSIGRRLSRETFIGTKLWLSAP